ncbi:cryptochrome/photolyase family protein [Microbulbifer hydrolyticus]|uniref:Deoxyribodipyrimidine photo-lyase n=1 Tax=Microbulbifer hydrolyticus TaxID=48074 RepID=A0A6P1T6H7_9GAMM|nr:FAD-binding domain-containing protein [Microbulbifer hydrolyticus]MBB5212850.1 deoxyribodipyrimidine photo-lyase [Microbulbifer hydrolyticus]QHQ38358.1 deoxyribodipyrimidine photolyase [Microbulbifer hydrolyticus]
MREKAYSRGLVWLRNDLRLHDNTALYRAARGCKALAAVFIACPQTWASHGDGDNVVAMRLRSLAPLQRSLSDKQIPLYFLELNGFADVPQALAQIVSKLDIDAVFANTEYPLNELRRDDAVRKALKENGVPIEFCTDRTLIPPGSLTTNSGDGFKVFTPFKRAFIAQHGNSAEGFDPLPAPRALGDEHAAQWPEWISLAGANNLVRSIPDTVGDYGVAAGGEKKVLDWAAGEKAANKRLQAFSQIIADYEEWRDFPARENTSRLSPYLNCGAISIRQCAKMALDANDGRWAGGKGSQSEGATSWLNELLWREFYQHLVVNYPRVCRNRPFKPETERVPWSRRREDFERWCEGQTGVPIVDAAMRQLNQTGWMHNRLRMVVASFLTKNLLTDWRKGERYFMQHLVDADFAANNGGWQWAASTGTDSAPYFRVFNPYSQSKRFDPEGEFIRTYIPELAALSSRDVHCPPQDLFGHGGYPEPVCDVTDSRKKAIEVFASLKS